MCEISGLTYVYLLDITYCSVRGGTAIYTPTNETRKFTFFILCQYLELSDISYLANLMSAKK